MKPIIAIAIAIAKQWRKEQAKVQVEAMMEKTAENRADKLLVTSRTTLLTKQKNINFMPEWMRKG